MCPPASTFPAPNGTGSYAVVIKADIKDLRFYSGWSELGQGWETQLYNISAHTCGLLQIPSLAVSILPNGIVFDLSHEVFASGAYSGLHKYNPGFGPGASSKALFTLTPQGTSITTLTGVRPGGSPDVSATTTATLRLTNDPTGTGGVFDCPTTATTTLSTGRSTVVPPGRGPNGPVQAGQPGLPPWTLQGTPLTGPLQHAHAVVVANNFQVPIFNENFNDPNNHCSFDAAIFNGYATGTDAHGNTFPHPGGVQPAGVTQVTGNLEVTQIDPKALPDGPPNIVPGT